MNEVKVTATKNGLIIPSKNPAYSSVRVASEGIEMKNGWARKVSRSAFIKGETDVLKASFTDGMKLPGQIVVTESHTPTNPDNIQQDLKIAGDCGVVCSIGGTPIYRASHYSADLSEQSTYLEHDNKEEIKAAQVALAEASSEEAAL